MKTSRLINLLNLDLVALLEVYCNIFLKICVIILCSLPMRFKKLGTGASLSLSMPTRFRKLGTGASLSLSMPTRFQKLGIGASLSLSIPTRFQKLGTGASLSLSMPTQYRQMTEEFFLTFYPYKTSQKAIN